MVRLDGDAQTRCELVDGTLVEKTMGWEQGIVEVSIARVVSNFVSERKLGLCDGASTMMRLLPTKVRMPDFSFFSNATLARRDKNARPRDRL